MVRCRLHRTGRNIVTGLDQPQATTTTGWDYYYYHYYYYCYYYWLGFDKVYRLMQLGSVRLRIEVWKCNKNMSY